MGHGWAMGGFFLRWLLMRAYHIQITSMICQMVAYRRLKTKENFKLLALKVVSVAYKSL